MVGPPSGQEALAARARPSQVRRRVPSSELLGPKSTMRKEPRLRNDLRVAALQYFIRPVTSFQQFADQVSGLVATAADYKADLVVFPE